MGFVRWREEETYDCDSEQTSAGGLPCIFLTGNYDCRSLKLFCRVTMSRDRHLNEHASAEDRRQGKSQLAKETINTRDHIIHIKVSTVHLLGIRLEYRACSLSIKTGACPDQSPMSTARG